MKKVSSIFKKVIWQWTPMKIVPPLNLYSYSQRRNYCRLMCNFFVILKCEKTLYRTFHFTRSFCLINHRIWKINILNLRFLHINNVWISTIVYKTFALMQRLFQTQKTCLKTQMILGWIYYLRKLMLTTYWRCPPANDN